MRFYKDREKKILVRIQCNCCGRELEMHCGIPAEGVLRVEKDWGYFSKKDLKHHEFDLCEECYERMISEFRIPVEESEVLEL
ncbi:MAG: hypothetical protein ACI4DV_08670 [Lachnospiraceae bacterium]